MGRPLRPDIAGTIHHVMNRGVRGEDIFRTDHDRRLFMRLAVKTSKKYEIRVLGYCLMPNHFHLVLDCPSGNLSAMMRDLSGRYARAFNRSYGLRGALFGQRFHSVLIETDNQLLATSRYVDRNPLELKIRIDNYPWSGFHQAVSGDTTGLAQPQGVLELAGGRKQYQAFVEAPLPSDRFHIRDGTRNVKLTTFLQPVDVVDLVQQESGARTLRSAQRQATAVIALDALLLDPTEVAEVLRLPTVASVRAAARRARRRLVDDVNFADLVHSVGARIAA